MPIYEICSHVYLADYASAKESGDDFFVINCTKDFPMIRETGLRLAIDDNGSMEAMKGLLEALPYVTDKIHALAQQGINVVVHCLAGQQRSPAVVAAYLIHYMGLTLDQAIQFVKLKKHDAFLFGVNFQSALEWYVESLE